MKKVLALIAALAVLCSCTVALAAPPTPAVDSFATMKTKQRGNTITVTLNKPVDRIWANWRGYKESPVEIELSESNTAQVLTTGHKYQLGVRWTNAWVREEAYVATLPIGISGEDYIDALATAQNMLGTFGYALDMNTNGEYGCTRTRFTYNYVEVNDPHYSLYSLSSGSVIDYYNDLDVREEYEEALEWMEENPGQRAPDWAVNALVTYENIYHPYEEDEVPHAPYEAPAGTVWAEATDTTCDQGDAIQGVDGDVIVWGQKGLSATASLKDRAYITLQGDWFVMYNRRGDIVDIVYNDGSVVLDCVENMDWLN